MLRSFDQSHLCFLHAQFDEHYFPFTKQTFNEPSSTPDFLSYWEPGLLIPSTSPTSPSAPPHSDVVSKSCLEPAFPFHSSPIHQPTHHLTPHIASPPVAALDNPPPSSSSLPNLESTAPSSSAPLPSHSMVTRSKSGIVKPKYPVCLTATSLLTSLSTASEPRSFKSALKFPLWIKAMQEEIDALHSNNTWDLVSLPPNTNVVGSKWVF